MNAASFATTDPSPALTSAGGVASAKGTEAAHPSDGQGPPLRKHPAAAATNDCQVSAGAGGRHCRRQSITMHVHCTSSLVPRQPMTKDNNDIGVSRPKFTTSVQSACRDSESSTVAKAEVEGAAAQCSITSLQAILQYQTVTRFFKDFCERTFCAENLYFYLDAENYQYVFALVSQTCATFLVLTLVTFYCHYVRYLPGSDFMKRTAAKICKKYVADDAVMCINISGPTRAAVLEVR